MTKLDDAAAHRLRDAVVQIFLVDARTGAVRQLTRGRAGGFDAEFSPDGGTLVFASGEGAPMLASRLRNASLHVISVDGSQRRVLLGGDGRRSSPRWSRDGALVLYEFQQDPYARMQTQIYDTRSGKTISDAATVRAAPVAAGANTTAAPAVRRFSWTGARGYRVSGQLRMPSNFKASQRYPLIVDPYAEWQTPDSLTNAGYLLFSPSPRAPHDPGSDSEQYRKLSAGHPG